MRKFILILVFLFAIVVLAITVSADEDLGYTGASDGDFGMSEDYWGTEDTAGQDGTVTTGYTKLKGWSAGEHVRMIVYYDNSGTWNLLGESNTLSTGCVDGTWVEFTFSPALSITNGETYVIGANSGTGETVSVFYKNSGSNELHRYGSSFDWDESPPDPISFNFNYPGYEGCFYLEVEDVASNNAPTQTNASPNGSSIHTVDNFTVDLNDADDDPLEWEMWTNYSGSWNMFDNGTGNGTQTSTNTSWISSCYEGIVYWSVNVTDGTDWTNTTYSFTLTNDPPWVHNPSDTGQVTQKDFVWSVDIDDNQSDTFNWSIEASNGQSNNSNNDVNGTYNLTLNLTGCDQSITIYVNVSDGCEATNETYNINYVNDPPWVHNPSHEGIVTDTSFLWTIDIDDNQSDLFNGSIECSNGDNTSGTDETNGTFGLDIHLSGCDENITIWVNTTDGCENTNETYFLEYINNPPEFSNLDPFDGETDVALPGCSITLNITDPEGDTFSYDWACSDGSYNSAIGNTNGKKYLMLCMEGIHTCGTTYTWWINASDGCEYTNNSYSFTTRDCEGEYSDIHPSNASSEVCPCVSCDNYTCVCINASHESGKNVNISFYSNYSGAWTMFEKYINVSGRYCAFFPVDYNTTYYWYVNVTEYGNDSSYNQTDIYSFTTALNVSNCTCSAGFDGIVDFADIQIIIVTLLFMYFLYVGYYSDKRSGGAFMLYSGFLLLYDEFLISSYISSILVVGLISPVALFIILLGLKKFLYFDSSKTQD